jgi:hypothetical protein
MNGLNYGLGIGAEYFIEQKFSIEFIFGYVRNYVEKETTSNTMGLNNLNQTSIESKGFEFRIGGSIFLK